MTYDNWVSGEPNRSGDCIEMNWNQPKQWNDDECDVKKQYICKAVGVALVE